MRNPFKKKSNEGWDCDKVTNPDGTRTCRRVEKEGEQITTAGTEITIGVDPNTCGPVFSGDAQRMMDDDEKEIAKHTARMTAQCRKDRGL